MSRDLDYNEEIIYNNAIDKCALCVEVNYSVGKEKLIEAIRGLKVETLLEGLDR